MATQVRTEDLRNAKSFKDLPAKVRRYIDWVAEGGTKILEDGEPIKQSRTQLAEKLGVDQSMFTKWKNAVGDNFWPIVHARREQIYYRRDALVDQAVMMGAFVDRNPAMAKLYYQQRGTLKATKAEIAHSGSLSLESALDDIAAS